MPLLNKQLSARDAAEATPSRSASALFPVCVNRRCNTGWLHVWRSRTAPVVEGGWSCSPACTRARIAELVHREREGHDQPAALHRHRIPIGLVLLQEGWITHDQLRRALEAQRAGSAGRLGAWLMEQCGLEERRVTQALSIQWNCPILTFDQERAGVAFSLVPRIFLDTFGFVPLRLLTAGILYIGFEDRIDHSLTLVIERMTGLRVEAGLVSGSEFRRARESVLTARFPRTRIIEAVNSEAMVDALVRLVEREKPVEARIVRVHGFYWLRLWKALGRSGASLPTTAVDGIADGSADWIANRMEDVISSVARFQ